jgi:hypothetical protein
MAKFMWCIARVDSRQYRQNSTELAPTDFWLGVEIPLTSEYVWNVEEILAAQLGSGNVDIPKPIYKNKAIEFCQDYFGEYLRDPDDIKPEDLQSKTGWEDEAETKSGSEDWGNTTTDTVKVEVESGDGWSDAIDTDSGLSDDESKNEMFNDEEETWE